VIDLKTRLLAIVGSLALLIMVVDLVRRRRLKEEYSVLWVAAAAVLLVLAAWYQLLGWVTTAIGGVALSTTLFFFALLFVFFMLLHYSVSISSLERRLTALVQEIALLGPSATATPTAGQDVDGPSISVIIPCFNDGPFLSEALASIIEPGRVEIVIVDDGSTDEDTLVMLESIVAEQAAVVIRQENAGLGAARTLGLYEATGDFIFPLDADDQLQEGALTLMAERLQNEPDADFTWGDYVLFGEQTGVYRSPSRWLPWTLTYVNPYPVSSMFRRSALEAAGGWTGRAYEDWNLWLRCAGLGMTGVRTDAVVYRRRIHGRHRLLPEARQRHGELYKAIREDNADLFASRARLRAMERPAIWKRVVYPLMFGSRRAVPVRVEEALKQRMMRRGRGLP
jgi:glycosyltransferase involved in cell wall biosynthesis